VLSPRLLRRLPRLVVLILNLLAGASFDNRKRRSDNVLAKLDDCYLIFPVAVFVSDSQVVIPFLGQQSQQSDWPKKNSGRSCCPDSSAGLLSIFEIDNLAVGDRESLAGERLIACNEHEHVVVLRI